jgi:hypothetical protein
VKNMFLNQNDLLSVLMGVVIFPLLWALHGKGIVVLPDIVLGATVTLETLIVQFYFRKAAAKINGNNGSGNGSGQ